MTHYERLMTVQASPEEVFRYVSDPQHLPQYLPTLHTVEQVDAGHIRVIGNVMGHPYDATGYFRVDAAQHKLEWGAEDNHYSGWLHVQGGDVTQLISDLVIHLSFAAHESAPVPDGFDEQMQAGIQQTLNAIRQHVEKPENRVQAY